MQYRPEIDGLRAVAVVPVILFHAGFGAFSGGYIGVDVFFVISGYLITTILLNDLSQGQFSLLRFYERRARRILPALVLVVACSLPFAFFSMIPLQLKAFADGLMGVATFTSNILFWRSANYFAPDAEENLLLHTWSLSVEEQFYILFPLLLLVLWRFGARRLLLAIVLISLASFLMAEFALRNSPAANFYLLPTRAWELGAGAICALLLQSGSPARLSALYTPLSVIGLALIAYAVFAFDAETRFPSVYTAVPVVGTALLILFARSGTIVARALSLRPLVFVGLLSYSAYLWHQPLFVLARLRDIDGSPGPLVMGALCVAVLPLAWLSWRFVETPFRHRRIARTQGAMLGLSGLSLAALIAIGGYGHVSDGYRTLWTQANPLRANTLQVIEQARLARNRYYDDGACRFNVETMTEVDMARVVECRARYGPGLFMLGDSHSMDFYAGLFSAEIGGPFVFGVNRGYCRPHTPRPECQFDLVLSFLADNPGLFRAILYTQAGFHLLQTTDGQTGRGIINDIGLSGQMDPDTYHVVGAHVDAVAQYLDALSAHAPVQWIGPRIEPHIGLNVIMHTGCNAGYALREGQAQVYRDLDDAISAQVAGRGFGYRSQIGAHPLDMTHDFISCDAWFWQDGDHWSIEGAQFFITALQRAGLFAGIE